MKRLLDELAAFIPTFRDAEDRAWLTTWHQRASGRYSASVDAGHILAMRVLQSDLYAQLDDPERAACDALIFGKHANWTPKPSVRVADALLAKLRHASAAGGSHQHSFCPHCKPCRNEPEHAENRRKAALYDALATPEIHDFIAAVEREALHQRDRWGAEHDAGKTDADWFWLIGYLAGKALNKPEKQLHHIITTAAACLNWHAAKLGVHTAMRPGIAPAPENGE